MRFSRGLSLSKQRAPIQEGKIFREIPQQRGKIPRSRFQLLGARAAAGGRGCRGVGRKFDSHHIRSALLGSFFSLRALCPFHAPAKDQTVALPLGRAHMHGSQPLVMGSGSVDVTRVSHTGHGARGIYHKQCLRIHGLGALRIPCVPCATRVGLPHPSAALRD